MQHGFACAGGNETVSPVRDIIITLAGRLCFLNTLESRIRLVDQSHVGERREDRIVMGQSSRPSYRRLIKEIVARCLLWSGIGRAIRLLLWRDRVLILVYHDPKPEIMDLHLTYLRRIAEPISLSDLDRSSNSRPRVVITIDDGHVGNRRLLEVFAAHGVRPTIFLCSCIVDTHRQFWWRHSSAVAEQVEHFKRLPNTERLSKLSAFGFRQDAECDSPAALSDQDIERMKPSVDFQSHGRFHPILTCCDDKECEIEIAQSRHEIEKLVDRDCLHFAYPNGNYGEREIAILKAAGYRTARTLDVGWNDADTDRFRLKGVPVSDDSSWAWFAVQISLIPAYFRYLRHGSFFGRSPQF
jgi:peptidoglycan/xylan/chitin deacetylase (PgdA/CDA1 family)